MGGAQMYIRNKLLYLCQEGWKVIVISCRGDNVIIPELKEFSSFIPEIAYPSYLYSKKIKQIIADRLIRAVNSRDNDEVIIESSTIYLSTWGETISKIIGAKHLIFLLPEQNVITNGKILEFMKFKYQRHELAGISKKTLPSMFKPFFQIPDNDSCYRLSASCNNVEADVDSPYLHQIDKTCFDYIIGGFSRLDKPFVNAAVNDFCQYASLNIHKKFLFIWIGDAPKGSRVPSAIAKKMQNAPNVEFILTGYLYPVPTRLLELCDVLISAAGSSRVCMRSGIPTITYDSNDLRPIGILGRTTKNSLFRDIDEPPLDFIQLMDNILVNKIFVRLTPNYKLASPTFQKHFDFINNACKDHLYFDFNIVNSISVKERIIKLLGPNCYDNIILAYKRLLIAIFNRPNN